MGTGHVYRRNKFKDLMVQPIRGIGATRNIDKLVSAAKIGTFETQTTL